jgi:hypothetical protein
MNERPRYYSDVQTCVEDTLSKVGTRIALGTPLGLGKANLSLSKIQSDMRWRLC